MSAFDATRDPAVRVSDVDREQLISILREHMVAGRLDTAQFSSRVGGALEATTIGELNKLLRDLPEIPLPIPTPATRHQRAALKQYRKRLTRWETARATKRSQLDLARSATGMQLAHGELPCSPGEKVFARVPGTVLRTWTTTAPRTERRTTSQYTRSVFGGGRRASRTITYQVPGREVQVVADRGVVYLTSKRICFRGSKRSFDTAISSSAGLKIESQRRRIVIAIPNGRPLTFQYPRDPAGSIAFAFRLALADSRGTVSSLVTEVEAELVELDRTKPVLDFSSFGPRADHAPGGFTAHHRKALAGAGIAIALMILLGILISPRQPVRTATRSSASTTLASAPSNTAPAATSAPASTTTTEPPTTTTTSPDQSSWGDATTTVTACTPSAVSGTLTNTGPVTNTYYVSVLDDGGAIEEGNGYTQVTNLAPGATAYWNAPVTFSNPPTGAVSCMVDDVLANN